MTETKLEFSKSKLIAQDEMYEKLKYGGAKNIHKWRLANTAASSDAAAETDAPDATFLGDVEEVTTIACTTKALTVGSEYINLNFSAAAGGGSGETEHYFYVDKAEITTITCVAKASCVAESSFHFWVDDGAGCQTEYYCWMNVSGTDSDPSESGTAIECNISGATTATDVAEVIDGLIDALDNVGAANVAAVLTITNDNNGNVTDCCDGDIATGFTIAIEQGGDDPNRAACCTITCSTQADSVANSTFHFFVADGSGGETEYYIWINKDGNGSDPEEDGTAIECDISGAGTAIEVAEVIDALIAAKDDVGCDNGGTATLPIINANAGSVTDPHDGETTATAWSFIFQDGTLDTNAVGTAHSCDISASTTADDVGIVIEGVIDGVAGYTTSEADGTITIESDATGNVTSCNQSGSSFTITIVNKGRDYYEGSYLYLVSASANDSDGATKHVRTVEVIGWDYNGDPAKVSVAMNGTTHVKLGTRLKAVSHMKATSFGSGGQDAADDITLVTSNTGNGTTLLTIAGGSTESNGARIYVPDGSYIIVTLMRLCNITNANTGSTMLQLFFSGFEHILNTDPDIDNLTIVCGQEGMVELKPIFITPRVGTDTAFITIKEREVSATGNETFYFEMEFYTFE